MPFYKHVNPGDTVTHSAGRENAISQALGQLHAISAPRTARPAGVARQPVAEYNGYFKIIDASTYNDDGTLAEAKIKIVDGATYDEETGTSGKGICKVNNVVFQVGPYQSGVIVSTCTFALKYTAPIAADESAGIEQQDAKIEVVNLLDEGVEFLPSDTSINCWYQIGRAIISTKADGTVSINVQQDHQGTATNGIPQIWWYALCEE